MEQQAGNGRSAGKKRFMAATAIAALALVARSGAQSAAGQMPAPSATTQPTATPPNWQTAAGSKMAFDVASVKLNKSDDEDMHANFPLSLGPNFATVGNLFSVRNEPMRTLIGFAYKLSVGQTRFLMPGLPSWVDQARFDINARAAIDNPTKDQFRLMVQSLLADRFKLTMHRETRQLPISELGLAKPGKTGPQLTSHVDDAKCGAGGRLDAPPPPADAFTFPCGAIVIGALPPSAPGRVTAGGRDISMDYIAAFLTGTAYQGVASDRLVVNKTGLNGEYDFQMEMVPQFNGPAQPAIPPDPNGPTFLEALQDQLGLKLKSTTGPVELYIVDHLEEPSEN